MPPSRLRFAQHLRLKGRGSGWHEPIFSPSARAARVSRERGGPPLDTDLRSYSR